MSFQPSRRNLLALGTAAASLAAAPAWIGDAFAQSTATAAASDVLSRALARAKAVGKPLFVILVPAREREQRGILWADFFSFASDEALADCALCEWVCATSEQLGNLRLRGLAVPTEGPLALVIETDEKEPATHAIANDLPSLTKAEREMVLAGVDKLLPRVAALSVLVHKAILSTPESLERRRAQCLAASHGTLAFPELGYGGVARPRNEAVDAYAGVLHAVLVEHPQRARWLGYLAQAAARRLWENDIAGARWEAQPFDPCPPCGMGSMGPNSRSFLKFYAGEAK